MTPKMQALLSFGANLGDRNAQWEETLKWLPRHGMDVEATSSLIETAPVGGPPGQEPFLNAAIRISTELQPQPCVTALLSIEQAIGRTRLHRWGPRLVDLDLLLYGSEVVESEGCLVPHPRMTFRRFMLAPALEIAQDWPHPISNRTVRQLWDQLQQSQRRVSLIPDRPHHGSQAAKRWQANFQAAMDSFTTDQQAIVANPQLVPDARQRLADAPDLTESCQLGLQAIAQWFERVQFEVDRTSWSAAHGLQTHASVGMLPSETTDRTLSVIFSEHHHPQHVTVHGPYLVLKLDCPLTWSDEVLAAIDAM